MLASGQLDQTPADNETQPAALLRRMEAAGISPLVHQIGSDRVATGASAVVTIHDVLGDEGQPADRLTDLRECATRGLPVTLMVEGNEDLALDRLQIEELFRRLASQFDADTLRRRLVSVATPVATFSTLDFGHLQSIDTIARAALGGGPRYVLVDPDAATECDEADRLWRALHTLQSQPAPPTPAVASVARSRCPLVGGELATSLSPGLGIASPVASAWLVLRLDILRFADGAGGIHEEALADALDACIELGDQLFDRLTWMQPSQCLDARANRRVVVKLEGIGDLVLRRKQDPADIRCLRAIDQLVRDIHERLWERSHRLAAQRGAFPALAEREPSADWDNDDRWRAWQRRWRQAVGETMQRHRNLLLMSPYGVLPRSDGAVPAFADLLPCIAHADALAFAAPPSVSRWNISDFKNFHQRVLALVERQNAASFVATGV